MKTPRRLLALGTLASAAVLFALSASACGGFSTEDAVAICEQEQDAREGAGCFEETSFDECVAAYEECGDGSIAGDDCPTTYSCPE